MLQAVHGWSSTYERFVKSQKFFSSYLTQEDLSRFGRNYLQVGYYTEVLLPKKGVRFIAINNSVDSANPTDNDLTPFLNIMNEWYAKDTSNKIKAVFKARMKNGLRCSGSIPYGYKRDKDDKQQLIVDEPAAEVVKRIYRLCCQGVGINDIAATLQKDRICSLKNMPARERRCIIGKTGTFLLRRAGRLVRHDVYPRGYAERQIPRRNASVAACRRRRAKHIMIRPYSHSPSVQSVAGNG